jgi:hypothetical protein
LKLDAVIYGEDFAAALASFILSKRGYRVLMTHKAPRLSEKHLYTPFTTAWSRCLVALGVPADMFTEAERLHVVLGGEPPAHLTPLIAVCVGNMRRMSEWLVANGEAELYLWCRGFSWKRGSGGVNWTLSRRGAAAVAGSASTLIFTDPEAGGMEVAVTTSPNRDGRGSLINLSGANPLLTVRHGKHLTSLHIGSHHAYDCISVSRVPLPTEIKTGEPPYIRVGLPSGLVVPPWIGDYLAASALLGVMIAETWAGSPSIDHEVLSYMAELRAQSQLDLQVVGDLLSKRQGSLTLRHVGEALEPPRPPPFNYKL